MITTEVSIACSICGKVEKPHYFNDLPAPGWLYLKYNDSLTYSIHIVTQYFCSKECLVSWLAVEALEGK